MKTYESLPACRFGDDTNLRPPSEPGAELVPEILLDQKGELELRGAPLKVAFGLSCFRSTDKFAEKMGHTFIRWNIYLNAYLHVCLHQYIHVSSCLHICIHIYIYIFIICYIYIRLHVHYYIYIYISYCCTYHIIIDSPARIFMYISMIPTNIKKRKLAMNVAMGCTYWIGIGSSLKFELLSSIQDRWVFLHIVSFKLHE